LPRTEAQEDSAPPAADEPSSTALSYDHGVAGTVVGHERIQADEGSYMRLPLLAGDLQQRLTRTWSGEQAPDEALLPWAQDHGAVAGLETVEEGEDAPGAVAGKRVEPWERAGRNLAAGAWSHPQKYGEAPRRGRWLGLALHVQTWVRTTAGGGGPAAARMRW